jgi:hypothetical protein
MANVFIDILAEFTGKKAFKQAEASTDKLSKSVKKLAGSLGVAFGTQQIVSYGKRAIKAFADSELEATRLTTAVSNLGLAFAAPQIDRYIDNIELATGVNRDQLQPAFLTLLRTTGSLTKSQELLNLSLDVAASEGLDAATVAEKLSQAYVGNAKGLGSLNIGLTKAELNSANFETVQKRLTVLFGGQGEAAANSYTASIAKLAIASEQASEIIGEGLVNSLLILSGTSSVDELAQEMLDGARNAKQFTENVAELFRLLNTPGRRVSNVLEKFIKATDPYVDLIIEGDPSGFMTKKPPSPLSAPSTGFNGKTFYADARKNAEAIAKAEQLAAQRAAKLLADKRKQQALEAKMLKDKRIGALIDKANLLLNKSQDVFDIDKIQNAAALANQAEQLGKATNGSQILQIANDTARLNVKRSILALEDAIAAKDEAAIKAATAKLNADLGILGALTRQDLKLANIKTILESLKPKDLINLTNLEEALALLGKINLASTGSSKAPTGVAASGIPINDFIAPISTSGGSIAAILEYAESATARANAFADLLDMQNAADAAAFNASSLGTSAGNTIIINTGVGDPNAIAEAIDQVLTDAFQRGTLRQFATK